MTPDPLDFTAPRAVDVADIEQTLERIWQDQGGPQASGAVTRACALNLAVYTEAADADEIDRMIGEITVTHPCRAIVVDLQPGVREAGTDAWISAHCHLAVAGQHVCCEQVHLQVRGEAVGRQVGTVLSLLVPDLPFFIWWRGAAPIEAEWFIGAVQSADRVILDAARADRPRAFFGAVQAALSGPLRGRAVSDLAWSRLTPWRELVAQSFDVPRFRAVLDRVERIEIAYGDDGDTSGRSGTSVPLGGPSVPPAMGESQALLAAGWFASRLQFGPLRAASSGSSRVSGSRAVQFVADSSAGPVRLTLEPVAPARAPGLIERIAITGHGGSRVAVARDDDGVCARVVAESPDGSPLARAVPLDEPGEAGLVAGELELLARDRVYEAALAALAVPDLTDAAEPY